LKTRTYFEKGISFSSIFIAGESLLFRIFNVGSRRKSSKESFTDELALKSRVLDLKISLL
jgi:hypothetical protein